ncbi:hypothetical protein A4R43_05845 [Amycolatopsis albispora]|uniref:DUF4394 domain-containing protein n=1 Tax=Amycolatopsis albispora TaxID=1804986 RepID=A0A344LJS8_9PSEU|nr:hypothetical protein A4R43_05845 [Amycolatopsis albispora]
MAAVTTLVAAAALAAGLSGGSAAGSTSAVSLRAYGITNDGKTMATFTTDRPEELNWVRRISGLVTDTAAIGIDFRVQDGKFYAVGNYGGIYTISLPTGNSDVVVTKVSQLKVGLHGTTFGVDFNPAADRLRVVSDTGQNLRHNLNDHTTVADGMLSTGPNGSAVAGVTAAAYTNNDLNSATATTLFDLNTITAQVAVQSPANNGFVVPTGSLGTTAASNAGADIYSDLVGGKTASNWAFATLITPSGDATLFTFDPLTGTATALGVFPLLITDVAVALDTY